MDVRFVWTARNADKGKISLVSRHPVEDIPDLLARTDGLVWVDIPSWDDEAKRVLTDVFCFHPLAIRDCMERNQVPKVHVYPGHVFLVMHAPFGGKAGHVHYIELDQFVGDELPGHGARPAEPGGGPGGRQGRGPVVAAPTGGGAATSEGGFRTLPRHRVRADRPAAELHGAPDAGRLETRTDASPAGISAIRRSSWTRLFRARHGLLTVETMASLSREVYARMAKIEAFGPGDGEFLVEDIVDQFARLRAMAHGQKEYLVRAPSSSTRRGRTPR